jgi:hypothetical protein
MHPYFNDFLFQLFVYHYTVEKLFECECVQEKYYFFGLLYGILEWDTRKGKGPQTEWSDHAGQANEQCSIMLQVSPHI